MQNIPNSKNPKMYTALQTETICNENIPNSKTKMYSALQTAISESKSFPQFKIEHFQIIQVKNTKIIQKNKTKANKNKQTNKQT